MDCKHGFGNYLAVYPANKCLMILLPLSYVDHNALKRKTPVTAEVFH
ncbi:hypothetical protein SAMN04488072_104200 [Lentibacillus halodurans]|uniref:Uncharacterized protein n=1 Tax=Lentibacillus halodurans TaxID=237679 RepID=A0A1I0X837_9BACI|nr:hypothetical protein SAMN04488072_104200 [Lentibacillus halodurans]